jgi:hypothetical protein
MPVSRVLPTPLATLSSLFRGHLPRVWQARGWVLAALAILPVALAFAVITVIQIKGGGGPNAPQASRVALEIFHSVMVKVMLPVMALVAASAGIREDLEQRTLPLFLVRPLTIWSLPLGKALPWVAWGSVWLLVANLALLAMGANPDLFLGKTGALLGIFWGQLAFITLLSLVFKRGVLWGALYLFILDPLVRVLPANLQRFTFIHYAESLAGSRGNTVQTSDIFAQTQITTAPWLAFLILLAFGLACWALSGLRLHHQKIGLAGAEAEG